MASNSIRSGFKRSALTIALGLCFAGTVHAQSTTGVVYGNAAPGEAVTVVSETGFARTVGVDSTGRYSISNLPVGNYTVTAKKGDQVVGTKQILVKVSSGTEASFAGAGAATPGNELGTITVTAHGAGIDVTQVDSRTVITAKDLAVLPIAHSAEAIAMLAPGTVKGSGYFGKGNEVSFGGAGVTENAYYINGFNVSELYSNIGGLGLPYGSIAQQETYTGGYSAMYGRSDGGVISQVGKRGTNEWHFGGQVTYRPKALASAPKDVYYPKAIGLPGGLAGDYTNAALYPSEVAGDSTCPAATPVAGQYCWHYDDPNKPGKLFRKRSEDKLWNTTYSAYVGGPLVPNKLFFFLSAEQSKDNYISTSDREQAPTYRDHFTNNVGKIYAKIDWNINDTNILELTGIKSNDHTNGSRYYYNYDPVTFAGQGEGAYYQPAPPTKTNTRVEIAKYTNYLSDNLNFSVTYGKQVVNNPTLLAINSPLPYIAETFNMTNPPAGMVFPQPYQTIGVPTARLQGTGVRFDVEYKIGAHQFHGGIDDMTYKAKDQGTFVSGPGYYWDYQNDGTHVFQQFYSDLSSSTVVQKAAFIEDNWSITDRFVLKMGLRTDDFNNKNDGGQSYVHQKHQLAPRLGFAWDLKGDSTMKLFGNLGRYYLALPNSVAKRGASPSTYYYQKYTYTGIDSNGIPTGLTNEPNPTTANGGYSGNNEFGQIPDPNGVAAKGLKSQYQDEGILGLDYQFSKKWVAGAKVTYRKLGTLIDDWCDSGRVAAALPNGGVDYKVSGCYIINPGRTNTFHIRNNVDGSYTDVTLTNAQLGFDSSNAAKPIRKYEALDLYLEHPFDGKWQWRMDYTWSRNPGNTEGQVKSDIGQTDVSKTQDWDYGGLMYNSYGYMANDRRHSLRMRGMYQFAPEWLVTGNFLVQSGTPFNCLGYYFNDGDPIGYTSSYHTCLNQPAAPGATHGPWTKQLDLGLVYRPKYFDKKLTLAMDVFNVTNDRKPRQYNATLETGQICHYDPGIACHGSGTIYSQYHMPIYFQSPRYVQLSVSYDY